MLGPRLSKNLRSNLAASSTSAFCKREEEKRSSMEGTQRELDLGVSDAPRSQATVSRVG